jgi:hypothetical protein
MTHRHHEILVSYALPAGFQFRRVGSGEDQSLVDAKIFRCSAGDTISWKVEPLPESPMGKQITGLTIEFLSRTSPFDSKDRRFSFEGLATTRMTVLDSASSKFFPYELTFEGVGLKADPGVGVDPPGYVAEFDLQE